MIAITTTKVKWDYIMTDLRRIVDEIPNDDMVLTIIISCYNTRDLVRDCLRSIYEYPRSEAYEIILSTTVPWTGRARWCS